MSAPYLRQGRAADAETEAMRAWSTLPFAADEEPALIALAPEAVGFVHELRLDTLLWEGRSTEAERMLKRVPEGPAGRRPGPAGAAA